MRTLTLLFFTLRQLVRAVIIYNLTRFLPADLRSRIRQRQTLRGARRVARLLRGLGGLYIKASQYLATVSNVFDGEYADLFTVPETLPTHSPGGIQKRLQAEFGKTTEELFKEFDPVPIASASLGQVHSARLRDGRRVAVKLLHAGIESQIREDLFALRFATRMITWFFPDLDFRGHVSEFATMILSEIDYENEAENIRRMRDLFKDEPRVIVPAVVDDLSRETVLTTEFISGFRIDDERAMKSRGVERRAVTELLLETYSRMIFEHRFFHADPHPGNIFVVPADAGYPLRVGFVDFGATQSVTQNTFTVLKRIFEVNQNRDFAGLVDLAVDTGILGKYVDRERYADLFELIYSRYASFKIEDDYYRINPLRFGRIIKIKDLALLDIRLRDVLIDARFPRRYIYLGRTITLLISLALDLDDRVNIFTIAKPYVEVYMAGTSGNIFAQLRAGRLPRGIANLLAGKTAREPDVDAERAARLGRQVTYEIARQFLLLVTGLTGVVLAAQLYMHGDTLWAGRALIGGGLLLGWTLLRSLGRKGTLFGKRRE